MGRLARKDLIKCHEDFEGDQSYNNQFETQRSLCVDDIGESICSLSDY